MPVSKKAINYVHFKRRLMERHNMEINKKQFYELVNEIKRIMASGLATTRLTLTRSEVHCRLKEKPLRFIYDRKKGSIVTVLPDKVEL